MPEETRELDVAAIRERIRKNAEDERAARPWRYYKLEYDDLRHGIDRLADEIDALLARITALEQERDHERAERANDHRIWERRLDDAQAERDAYKRNTTLAITRKLEAAEARITTLETLLAVSGALIEKLAKRDQCLAAILAAFQDEDDPDQCEDCHELVLCNFHTLLSMLHGRTEPTP